MFNQKTERKAKEFENAVRKKVNIGSCRICDQLPSHLGKHGYIYREVYFEEADIPVRIDYNIDDDSFEYHVGDYKSSPTRESEDSIVGLLGNDTDTGYESMPSLNFEDAIEEIVKRFEEKN